MRTAYQKRYFEQVDKLSDWFEGRLAEAQPLTLTAAQYAQGVDALPEELKKLTTEAMKVWRDQFSYELSYHQVCRAFFTAMDARLQKLKIV